MGFFDFISDALDAVTDFVSDAADFVVEKVSDGIDWLLETVEDLFDSPSDSGSNSYKPPRGDYENNAVQANNHLATIRTEMADYAKDAEAILVDAIMKQYKKSMDGLRTWMQKKGVDKILAIDFDELQEQSNELTDSVKGNLSRYYNDYLVATNEEVKAILKEANYEKRQKKFDSYCEKLHKKALDNLRKRIKQTIDAQTKLLDDKVQKAIAALGRDMEKQKKILDDLLKEKQGKETESHQTQLEQIYAHGVCEILGTQLEEAQTLLKA